MTHKQLTRRVARKHMTKHGRGGDPAKQILQGEKQLRQKIKRIAEARAELADYIDRLKYFAFIVKRIGGGSQRLTVEDLEKAYQDVSFGSRNLERLMSDTRKEIEEFDDFYDDVFRDAVVEITQGGK